MIVKRVLAALAAASLTVGALCACTPALSTPTTTSVARTTIAATSTTSETPTPALLHAADATWETGAHFTQHSNGTGTYDSAPTRMAFDLRPLVSGPNPINWSTLQVAPLKQGVWAIATNGTPTISLTNPEIDGGHAAPYTSNFIICGHGYDRQVVTYTVKDTTGQTTNEGQITLTNQCVVG